LNIHREYKNGIPDDAKAQVLADLERAMLYISRAKIRLLWIWIFRQGAGVTAAEAVKQNTPVNAVEIKGVQEELRRQNVILDI
jgi:hypothetical protein